MTLIAGLNDIYGGCCLFGDLMVTTRSMSAPSTQYPTKPVRFSGGNQVPINSTVVRLTQKIESFSDNIIAGFAGGETNIVGLSRYIRNVIDSKNISFEEIEKALIEYLRLHDKTQVPQMILFYAYPGTNDTRYFCINESINKIEQVGDLYCVGTGKDDFIKFMSTRAKDRFKTIVSESVVPADKTLLVGPTVMLEFMEEVMFYQRETGWGVKNDWGGGCELYYRQPGGFVRVDNILFQSFVCRNSGSRIEFQERSKVLQQYSDNDELIIKLFHVALPTSKIHIIPSLKRFGMPFYKQDYQGQDFDQPIFTMTNIRNVDTGQRWRFAQHRPEGDRNALLGHAKASDWVSYDKEFLASYIAENS